MSESHRLRGGRSAVAMMALACAVAACAGGSTSATVSPTASSSGSAQPQSAVPAGGRFVGTSFRFDYPAGWHTRQGMINPSGNWTEVYVSPQPLPSECRETAQGGGCGAWPIMRLSPDGLVLAWRDHGNPGSVPPVGGQVLSIGGRSARLLRASADEGCTAIGGDESIEVVTLPTGGETAWSSVDACLAGPDHGSAEAALSALEASISWTMP
jgi:hypothetical protein